MINIKLELIRESVFQGPDYDFWDARNRRDVGEDVYRKLHDVCPVDLEEIDRAEDSILVRAPR